MEFPRGRGIVVQSLVQHFNSSVVMSEAGARGSSSLRTGCQLRLPLRFGGALSAHSHTPGGEYSGANRLID